MFQKFGLWFDCEIWCKWDGTKYEEISKDLSKYRYLPWEIEAYSNMSDNILFDKIVNSKYWLELKGQDRNIDFIIKNL